MPCLKCGGRSEGNALLCDACADASFVDPKLFLNPVLIGPSLYYRMRDRGSAACLLGPNTGSDVVQIASADLQRHIKDMGVQGLPHEDLKGFYQRCDALLAHLGVPLKTDSPMLLLTEDASDAIMTIVQKVNTGEKMYPFEGIGDLYLRMGIVYWSAAHGILMRTASEKWAKEKRSYLLGRAKEYLSKVNPADDLYSIAARDMGMMCLDAEEWSAAEEHLAAAFRHFPNDFKIGEGLARAHMMLGNYMEALTSVDEVLAQVDRAELWVLKGRILRETGRPEEAIECFNRALQADSKHAPAYDELIRSLRDAGRLEEAALAESQRALSRKPDLEQKIGELLFQIKTAAPEKGVSQELAAQPLAARAVLKPSPGPAPTKEPGRKLVDVAKDALRARDFESAIVEAQHVLRGNPSDCEAILVLIEALISKGDLKEAAPRVHAYYERNNVDPRAWYWRGEVAKREGRWGAAVQYFSKAVSLDQKMVSAWVSMGETLLDHDKPGGADESFSRALEMDPDNARAWFGKGKALVQLGRWGAAIQCLERYIAIEPGKSDAWLLKADILFEKEKYTRALEAYERYIALVGDDSYALVRKGMALNAVGRTDEAKLALEESIRLDPGNRDAAKWLKTLGGGS